MTLRMFVRPSPRGIVAIASLAALCTACATSGDRPPPPLSLDRITEIVASPDRSAADRTNDVRRKPVDLLDFIGVRPGMTALDVSAGGGYTTELIARAVGPAGRVYGQSPPPNPDRAPPAAPEGNASGGAPPVPPPPQAPRRTSAMALAERAKNPVVANIVPVVRPFESPAPPELAARSFDLVTLMFNYHDLGHLGVDRAAMNRALFAAVKPGGMYVIADHAGRAGTGISESGTLHRVEETFVIDEVQSAGFRLVSRGEFLRNPNDPRDRNTPEPPQPKDEFVLKFVRP